MEIPYSTLSVVIGWTYTLLWSASFFPQTIFNWHRRTTRGTTADYPAINIIGFAAYLSSNLAFLFSSRIREQYASRNSGLMPTVTFNDLAFAVIAIVSTAVLTSQYLTPNIWGFASAKHENILSTFIIGVIVGCLLGIAIIALIVLVRSNDENAARKWATIDTVYSLSYVKLVVTLIKYSPQVYANYLNKSTAGWSISQIALDFAGGILSLLQLFIDAWLQADWSGIVGNPVKLGLGLISMTYDCVFFMQHCLLYQTQTNKGKQRGLNIVDESQSLLNDS